MFLQLRALHCAALCCVALQIPGVCTLEYQLIRQAQAIVHRSDIYKGDSVSGMTHCLLEVIISLLFFNKKKLQSGNPVGREPSSRCYAVVMPTANDSISTIWTTLGSRFAIT